VWTFATLPFRASFEGPDLVALAERLQELDWAPDGVRGDPIMWIDDEELAAPEDIVEAVARATRDVTLGFSEYPQLLRFDLTRGILHVGMPHVPIDMFRLAEQLATVPFEVASFASLYQTEWNEPIIGEPRIIPSPGHVPMGWGVAFRGRGHDRLPSREWIDHGPWKVWRGPEDVSVIQLHALDADLPGAIAEATPGSERFRTRESASAESPAWALRPPFDFSAIELGEQVRSGTGDAVHLGRSKRDGAPLLITITNGHAEDPASNALEYAFANPGITPLFGLGAVTGQRFGDALVELLPPGRPALELAPIGESRLATLGLQLAQTFNRTPGVIDGIQPELIYVNDDAELTGVAPRGPRFIATARPFAAGPRSYPVPYDGPECLVLGKPSSRATDVFALCASLFVLATGRHPFGALDDLREIMSRMIAYQPETLPGPLGEILAKGLVAETVSRPSMLQLASWFSKLR
jgi:hypothetical protein